jgi:hypothetical protein
MEAVEGREAERVDAPTTAASIRPAAIIRRAEANTLALEEQAEETTAEGPSRPSSSCTNAARE